MSDINHLREMARKLIKEQQEWPEPEPVEHLLPLTEEQVSSELNTVCPPPEPDPYHYIDANGVRHAVTSFPWDAGTALTLDGIHSLQPLTSSATTNTSVIFTCDGVFTSDGDTLVRIDGSITS